MKSNLKFPYSLIIFHAAAITSRTTRFYIERRCGRCSGPFLAFPRESVRYYGKTEIRLCPQCKRDSRRNSRKRTAHRKWLQRQTEVVNRKTHSTPKKRAYEALDALFQYFEETRLDDSPTIN